MDEETMDEDVGALSAMGDIDLAQIKSDPMGLLQKVLNRQTAAQNVEEKTLTDLYEKGRANIIARNQGPSTSEQLFALSKALLAPRYHRGIAGTIGKISGAFGDIGEAERAARMAREEQLSKFDEVYGSKLAGLGTRRAQTAADLVKTAATLNKPAGSVWDPNLRRFIPKGTPVPIEKFDLDGRELIKYSDGTSRLYGLDGNTEAYEILDATGKVIGKGAD